MHLSNKIRFPLLTGLLILAALAFAPPDAAAQESGPGTSAAAGYRDWGQGLSWYRTAAEGGDRDAQYRLGLLLERGVEVEASPEEARDWFRRAAEQGHGPAQFRLGTMLQMGQGGPQDRTAAAKWYRKAAAQGIAPAAFNLAVILERGGDAADAARFYAQAAKGGIGAAAANLAVLYLDGRGVAKDAVKALAWMTLAAEAGVPGAPEARNGIASGLTPAQQAEAQAQLPLLRGQ